MEMWNPIEKGCVGKYVIRFLPNPDGVDGIPWVRRDVHMLNVSSKHLRDYREGDKVIKILCKKSINESCPLCEKGSEFFNSGHSKLAQVLKKISRYLNNVYIVSDPREEGINNGKVMVWEHAGFIHDKYIDYIKTNERIYFNLNKEGVDFQVIVKTTNKFSDLRESSFLKKGSKMRNVEDELIPLNETFMKKEYFEDDVQMEDFKRWYIEMKLSA